MRLLTISEIEQLDSGEIIPAFTGTVKKVFEQKSGENRGENKKKYGDFWHIQNAIVTDGTSEIHISWGGEDSLSNLEGQVVTFESTDTKHGKQGLKWEVRNVEGKIYKSVKITGAAKIHSGGTGIPEKGAAEKHAEDWIEKKRNGTPTPQETSVVLDDSDSVNEVRHALMRAVNAMYLIEHAVTKQVEQATVDGITCTPENFGGKCGSLFRYLDSLGLVKRMPDKPLWSITQRNSVAEKAGELSERIEKEGLHGVKDADGNHVW
jgi:hypothetical protein